MLIMFTQDYCEEFLQTLLHVLMKLFINYICVLCLRQIFKKLPILFSCVPRILYL